MSRGSGGGFEPAKVKSPPLVFGKYAYRLWVGLCVGTGIGFISLMVIWLTVNGGM